MDPLVCTAGLLYSVGVNFVYGSLCRFQKAHTALSAAPLVPGLLHCNSGLLPLVGKVAVGVGRISSGFEVMVVAAPGYGLVCVNYLVVIFFVSLHL